MTTATELRNGVHVHTKLSRKNKRTVEILSKQYALPENVIFNMVISKGIAVMKFSRKLKK